MNKAMRVPSSLLIIGSVILTIGCSERPSTPPANTVPNDGPRRESVSPQESDTNTNQPPDQKYSGPAVTVQVIQIDAAESVSTAIIDVTTPTGGWTFTIDETKFAGETVQIYMTLEGPGADELVTQSLVPHQEQFTSDKQFAKAEVYVHLARRDVQTLTTNYRLAATGEGGDPARPDQRK
jgi:hypothetical protein